MTKKSKKSNELTQKDTGNDPQTAKTPKGYRENNKIDKGIRLLSSQHPDWSLHRIGLELKAMGVCKHELSVYKRVKKNPCLNGDLAAIRAANQEILSREIVPLALKAHKEVLSDKTIPALQKKDFIALAEKMEFSPARIVPTIAETVNIEKLQLCQTIVAGHLESSPEPRQIEDILDVEPEEI